MILFVSNVIFYVFLTYFQDKSHQIYIVGHFACWINILLDIYCWSFCLLDRSIYCWIYKPSCCCSLKHAGKKNAIWHINRVSQGHGTRLIGILCHGRCVSRVLQVPAPGLYATLYNSGWTISRV